jgi:hypothetical protein
MLLIIILLGPFLIFTKIHGDIHNFVFIAGIVVTCDKLFTGVNDSADILTAINYCWCR